SVFFCQAEDGIRDFHVTGVQTCALPICAGRLPAAGTDPAHGLSAATAPRALDRAGDVRAARAGAIAAYRAGARAAARVQEAQQRSEERRVGKECTSRWEPVRS